MNLSLKELLTRILRQGEFRTLLWENPNMTGEMGATTITLSDDLSNYDAIEIDYNAYVNVHRTSQRCYNISQDITLSNGDTNSLYRTISKASERTLSIGIGYLGANASNQACIPRRIYGIKLGGVLRSPVIARLSAIFMFGGGVSEGHDQRTSEQGADGNISQPSVYANLFCDSFNLCKYREYHGTDSVANGSKETGNAIATVTEWKLGVRDAKGYNRYKRPLCVPKQFWGEFFRYNISNRILYPVTISERGWAA